MEALSIAAATVDLLVEHRARLQLVLAADLAESPGADPPLSSSARLLLVRELVEALIDVAGLGVTRWRTQRLAVLADRLGGAELAAAFRRALPIALGEAARPMVVNAWSELLSTFCPNVPRPPLG